tara:strand:- start:103 stop:372 length:270 start_codon:yes stop_codon:yes gene_type:complete
MKPSNQNISSSGEKLLISKTSLERNSMEFPKFLTEKQVSLLTKQSQKTLQQHRWKNRGIPFHKFGGTVRYSEEDVFHYMNNCRIETEVD